MRKNGWIILVVIFSGILIYGIVANVRTTNEFYWMPIGIVGLTFTIIWKSIFSTMVRNRRVLRTGEPGSARVLRMFETGVTVNNNPMVKLELEVTPQRGATFVATAKVLVSRLNPMVYRPGTIVPVKIDPKDPTWVVIDNGASNTAPASGMAQEGAFASAQVNEQRNAAMSELLQEADRVRVQVLDSPTSRDAEGTILSLWSLDVNVNNIAIGMEFLVEVDIPGQPSFKTEIKGVVSNESLSKYHIGKRVQLKYDPVDPKNRITISGVV